MRSRIAGLILIAGALLFAAAFIKGQSPPPTITINPNVRYQAIHHGWEAVAQAGESDFPDFDLYKDSLFDQAVNDGIMAIRLPMRAATERPAGGSMANDNADPLVVNPAGFQSGGNPNSLDTKLLIVHPMRARAVARGESFWVTLAYDSTDPPDQFQIDNPEEYAELFEWAFSYIFDNFSWIPNAIEIVNEPNGMGSVWTNDQIGANLLATRARLASRGWYPTFILPGSISCAPTVALYNSIKSYHPTAMDYVSEISFHEYPNNGVCTPAQYDALEALAVSEGKSLAMLECAGGSGGCSKGNFMELHALLKRGLTAWMLYTLAYDGVDTGGHYYVVDHVTHDVKPGSSMKFLRQYFKHVRRNAVRIDALSNNASLDSVAFENTNGRQVVVVKAAAAGPFTIVGLKPGSYGIFYTTGTCVGNVCAVTEYDKELPDQGIACGQALTTSIPGPGVITIYGKDSSCPTSSPSPTPTATPSATPTPTPTATPTPTPTPTNLLAAYEFNEGTGTITADVSGNGHTATLVGATWVTGKHGQGLSFDGVNQYVTGADIDFPAGPFTLTGWFKTGVVGPRKLLSKYSSSTNQIYVMILSSGHILAGLHDGVTWQEVNSGTPYTDDVWHHFAMVVSTTSVELFIDGVSKGSRTHDNSFPVNDVVWNIGRAANGTQYFQGSLDEIRFYNKALTSAEVNVDMSTP